MKQCLPTPFMMWTETRPAKERWRLPHSNYMPQGFGDLIFPAWPLPLAPSQVTSGLVSSVLTSIPKFPIVAAYHTWVFWWHFDHTQSWTHDPYSKALSSFSCVFILVDAVIFLPVWAVSLQIVHLLSFMSVCLWKTNPSSAHSAEAEATHPLTSPSTVATWPTAYHHTPSPWLQWLMQWYIQLGQLHFLLKLDLEHSEAWTENFSC